ncbi:MAG: AI-2E family transporter [Acidimicrobiia bacterium]
MKQPKETPEGVSARPEWEERWPPPSYWIKVGITLIAAIFAVRLMGTLQGILLIILASFVLAIGFQPAIEWLGRRGVRRGLGLAVVLMAFLIGIGGLLALAVPLVFSQMGEVIAQLPPFLDRIQREDGVLGRVAAMIDVSQLTEQATGDPATAIGVAGTLASFGFNFLTVIVVTPYFAMAMPDIKKWAVRLIWPRHREDFLYVLNDATDLMANFIVGNLVISLIAGVVTFLGLSLIGVPYALALAAWVAITDLIPVFGALLGAVGVAAVAFFSGPGPLVASLLLLVLYQLVENYLIAPRVMNRAVNLNPATVILALMVGGSLAGLAGALLALPIAALVKILLQEFFVKERLEQVRDEVTSPERRRRQTRSDGRTRPLP